MAAGIYYQRYYLNIEATLMRVIPDWMQRLLPPGRA